MAFPLHVEKSPQLAESGKAPISFVCIKTVGGDCIELVSSSARRSIAMHTMRDLNGGIVYVPQDQSKLYARIPVFRRLVLPGMFQIEGCVFDVVAIGEKENAPVP